MHPPVYILPPDDGAQGPSPLLVTSSSVDRDRTFCYKGDAQPPGCLLLVHPD